LLLEETTPVLRGKIDEENFWSQVVMMMMMIMMIMMIMMMI